MEASKAEQSFRELQTLKLANLRRGYADKLRVARLDKTFRRAEYAAPTPKYEIRGETNLERYLRAIGYKRGFGGEEAKKMLAEKGIKIRQKLIDRDPTSRKEKYLPMERAMEKMGSGGQPYNRYKQGFLTYDVPPPFIGTHQTSPDPMIYEDMNIKERNTHYRKMVSDPEYAKGFKTKQWRRFLEQQVDQGDIQVNRWDRTGASRLKGKLVPKPTHSWMGDVQRGPGYGGRNPFNAPGWRLLAARKAMSRSRPVLGGRVGGGPGGYRPIPTYSIGKAK